MERRDRIKKNQQEANSPQKWLWPVGFWKYAVSALNYKDPSCSIKKMAPLIALTLSFLVFRAVGFLHGSFVFAYFSNWHYALRAALGCMFLLTASAHWSNRRPDLMRMVPKRFGNAGLWVSLTGWAELAIAVGLQIHPIAVDAALAAVALLCCLFPANVKAAREQLQIANSPVLPIVPRFIIQVVFIVAILASI